MKGSPVPDLDSLDDLDWASIGLKVGLEIHRQLDGRKLFCRCRSGLEEDVLALIRRTLVPRDSELGSLDEAAVAEHAKGRSVVYEVTRNSCPIEIDEEPPIPPEDVTIENALRIALLLGCDPVDRVQFMRKIVIDGSNPSGFQRTAVIGMDGKVVYDDDAIAGIATVCLEEDAARRVPDPSGSDRYRLDRAGTPEIEISTDPCAFDPRSAVSLARRIGDILRSTGTVRRGIGSVRQDVNISVMGGPRVEVKLVQDLPTIGKVIRSEAVRHLLLMEVASILRERGVSPSSIGASFIDLTGIFKGTSCKLISSGMSKGDVVLGIRLEGFTGLMGERARSRAMSSRATSGGPVPGLDDVRRLGPEMAGYVKAATDLKGLFHSDELPGYGISQEEVSLMVSALGVDPTKDGFVVVCSAREKAEKALCSVIQRAHLAFDGVVPEVRKAHPDGRTEYMRPISGPSRMYPETDVPGILLGEHLLEKVLSSMPEDPISRMERLTSTTGLSRENIVQLNNIEALDRFESLISSGADPRSTSNLLLKGEEALGDGMDRVQDELISWLAGRLSSGAFPKEAIKEVLSAAAERSNEGDGTERIESMLTERFASTAPIIDELEKEINGLVAERRQFIVEKGLGSIGPLMGTLMKRFRGKVDGSIVESSLRSKVKSVLGDG